MQEDKGSEKKHIQAFETEFHLLFWCLKGQLQLWTLRNLKSDESHLLLLILPSI